MADPFAEIRAYVEDRFFSRITDQLAKSADEIGVEIQKTVTTALNGFFYSLSQQLNGLTAPAGSIQPYVPDWVPLGFEYEQYRKQGRTDFFVFSELPILRRRTVKSKKLKRSTMGLKRDRSLSLKKQLSEIKDFSKIYGTVVVMVDSHTTINKGGRRQYKAGTTRNGMRIGGQMVKKASDFVTITVDWVPKLAGQDVMTRGVTEAGLNPRVRRKLMNSKASYRPLVGPYLQFYRDTTIKQLINGTILKYGGAP